MLEEFVNLRDKAPEAFYALLKDKMSMEDILKINCATKKLYK